MSRNYQIYHHEFGGWHLLEYAKNATNLNIQVFRGNAAHILGVVGNVIIALLKI